MDVVHGQYVCVARSHTEWVDGWPTEQGKVVVGTATGDGGGIASDE